MFALDSDSDTDTSMTGSISSCSEEQNFETLDDCINQSYSTETMPLSDLVLGRKPKKQKTNDLRPITFVRFNTSLGKPKPVTIKALLDSGGSESLVTEKFTKKLRPKKAQGPATVWTTPGGEMRTNQKVKAQLTLPELQDDVLIEWDFHVTKSLGKYDMIIGRDMLKFLKIDLRFSDNVVEWDGRELPFKDGDATTSDSYHVNDSDAVEDAVERVKKILDAKYEKADLEEVCKNQTDLNEREKLMLKELLSRYETLFDGQLGRWHGQDVKLEPKKDAQPCHSRAHDIPRCHIQTLKHEVQRLVDAGVLKKVNRSEWAAPTFIIPKKDGCWCCPF